MLLCQENNNTWPFFSHKDQILDKVMHIFFFLKLNMFIFVSVFLSSRFFGCSFDLTPNSHNQYTKKFVAARRENEKSDLGSLKVKQALLNYVCYKNFIKIRIHFRYR